MNSHHKYFDLSYSFESSERRNDGLQNIPIIQLKLGQMYPSYSDTKIRMNVSDIMSRD